jgi:hypothetical protein
MGQGNDYLYCNGGICILANNVICVLDVDTSKQVCNIDPSSDRALEDSSSPGEISLLSFNDDIVTVHLKEKRPPYNSILVYDTKRAPLGKTRHPRTSYMLFARHTADCIYYGTHGVEDGNGYREWKSQAWLYLTDTRCYALHFS